MCIVLVICKTRLTQQHTQRKTKNPCREYMFISNAFYLDISIIKLVNQYRYFKAGETVGHVYYRSADEKEEYKNCKFVKYFPWLMPRIYVVSIKYGMGTMHPV